MAFNVLEKARKTYANYLLGKKLPLQVRGSCELSEDSAIPSCPHPVVVATLPKAGTYLIAKILKLHGLKHIDIHLSYDGRHVDDYRSLSAEDAKSNPKKGRVAVTSLELPILLGRLQPGSFYVGHCGCLPQYTKPLECVKKIFSYRELRSAIISFVNHLIQSNRHQYPGQTVWGEMPPCGERTFLAMQEFGPRFIEIANGVAAWKSQPGVVHFPFEDVSGRNGEEAQFVTAAAIMKHIGINCREEHLRQTLSEATGSSTRTHYPQSRPWDIWNKSCEDLFRELGGVEANSRLFAKPDVGMPADFK